MEMLKETVRQSVMRRKAALEQERSYFLADWKELSDFITPRAARFLQSDKNKPRRANRAINNMATLAARTLAGGMGAGVTNPARPWFRMTTNDPELADYGPVKTWLYIVESRMREIFIRSNLYNVLPNIYANMGVYGTACMLELEDPIDVVRFYPVATGSYSLGQSHRLAVDTLVRTLSMSVRQLVDRFTLERLSKSTQGLYKSRLGDQQVEVVHIIEPNPNADENRLEAKYKRFRSVYLETGGSEGDILSESGFDDFPAFAPRWDVTDDDTYGNGPGLLALGDVKGLQLEEKRKYQALDKKISPPMTAPSSMINKDASIMAGAISYYDQMQGTQGFTPAYQVNLNLNELVADMERVEERINKAFFVDLFLMMANDRRSGTTAREVEELSQERLMQLGPVLQRIDEDLLDPLIDRTFNIMVRKSEPFWKMGQSGLLPVPPPELSEMQLKIEYISVMAQAQKMVGTQSVERLTSFVANLAAQGQPQAWDKIELDAIIDNYADSAGSPPTLVVPTATANKIRAERAAAQQKQAAMEQAMAAAQGAKTLSQADTSGENMLTALSGAGALTQQPTAQ